MLQQTASYSHQGSQLIDFSCSPTLPKQKYRRFVKHKTNY